MKTVRSPRYTLDLALEVDGVPVRQHLTQLTEAGMERVVLNALMASGTKIKSCVPSESRPFDQGWSTA
jgi:hypothetical protein